MLAPIEMVSGTTTPPALNPGASTSGTSVVPIQRISIKDSSAVIKLGESLDNKNWMAWKVRMLTGLRVAGFEDYATGLVPRPANPPKSKNWDFNDNYTQFLIVNNILTSEMIHAGQCTTAHAMWLSLEAVHKSKGHQTIIAVFHNLFHVKAGEEVDMSEHLKTMKSEPMYQT